MGIKQKEDFMKQKWTDRFGEATMHLLTASGSVVKLTKRGRG